MTVNPKEPVDPRHISGPGSRHHLPERLRNRAGRFTRLIVRNGVGRNS